MGCTVSTDSVRVSTEVPKGVKLDTSCKGIPDSDSKLLLIKPDNVCNSGEKENPHDDCDVASFNPDSVSLDTNGSSQRDTPPIAKATIIRGNSTHQRSNNSTNTTLPHQVDGVTPSNNIILTPKHRESQTSVRRRSAGDAGNVTRITCIPRSLVESNSLLNSGFKEVKTKTPLFGPKNRHLKLTESQKNFFEMLDQKIAQGRDYCSEDEKSLSSVHSIPFLWRSDSNNTNGIMTPSLPQKVR